MVYQIYYSDSRPRQILFYIEYYSALDKTARKDNKNCWYVELHSNSFISGAVEFIAQQAIFNLNKSNNSLLFNFDEFKKDCYEIEELRGWLWETHDNHLRTIEEVNKDKSEWGKYLEGKIHSFADKYGLYVNED